MRTRAALIEAARTVFERDGYANARLTDITDEAGTATGSFYTYFDGKEDIFAAVLEQVQDEMLHLHVRETVPDGDPIKTIRAANEAYLEAYERNAKLMGLLEEVAFSDESVRELQRRRVAAFAKRNGKAIRDLQRRGLADPEIDPNAAATALSGMVSRMAYITYILGDHWEREELVETLTRLWSNALGIASRVERHGSGVDSAGDALR
jgi:AcrR family transcriptional regulator